MRSLSNVETFERREGCRYRLKGGGDSVVRDLSYSRMSSPGTPHFNKLSRRLWVCASCACGRASASVCVSVNIMLFQQRIDVYVSELLIIIMALNFHD